jgi:hypothetical protein
MQAQESQGKTNSSTRDRACCNLLQCDQAQPACGYCTLRRLNCEYLQESSTSPSPSTNVLTSLETLPLIASEPPNEGNFNDTTWQIPNWVYPAADVITGQLSLEDSELLWHYKTSTWQTFAVRGDTTTLMLHKERVPQLSISHSYLLYALLSVAASHRNVLQPSKQLEEKALIYRQKTFQAYTKELQNITSDNYETILMTATFLLALIPLPPPTAEDEEHLDWMFSLLKLSEGLRILVSLRWAQGIEKLSIYPLVCRELRTLPPPPDISVPDKPILQTRAGPLGTTPAHPNPASTYDLPYVLPFAGFVFLPPPLLALLETIIHPPETGPLDLNSNILAPVFHVLSPIFLSLYYYHLNPDFFVRIFVFTSFLMPEFLALVKEREPRALVLMAWFFALANLVPHGWWVGMRVRFVVKALGRAVRARGDGRVIEALEGAERLIAIYENEGKEKAAESIFECWEGVDWDDEPRRAEEWELGLLVDMGLTDGTTDGLIDGLTDGFGFSGLDLNALA